MFTESFNRLFQTDLVQNVFTMNLYNLKNIKGGIFCNLRLENKFPPPLAIYLLCPNYSRNHTKIEPFS